MSSGKLDSTSDLLEHLAFQRVKFLLRVHTGLNCGGYRDEYLKRRFEVRLRATSSESYGKYVVYLNRHPEEYQLLLNDLAINFTMFFRDLDVYKYLETTILPKLFASGKPVNIWSAGCATGEESYSLAILAHKLLGNSAKRRVSILASDIDPDALARAEKGLYHKRQLNGLSEALFDRYFTREEETFLVRDFLRPVIRYERFDLNNPYPNGCFDLIMCRNVMIYFTKEGQQRIQDNFYNALREGGYYITGKAEVMIGESCKKFESIDVTCRIYKKITRHSPDLQTGLVEQAETARL